MIDKRCTISSDLFDWVIEVHKRLPHTQLLMCMLAVGYVLLWCVIRSLAPTTYTCKILLRTIRFVFCSYTGALPHTHTHTYALASHFPIHGLQKYSDLFVSLYFN